jgi:hypothetical protein
MTENTSELHENGSVLANRSAESQYNGKNQRIFAKFEKTSCFFA